MPGKKYIRGPLVIEGKTKRIYDVIAYPNLCIVESKNAITANDDPSLTKEFGTKAMAANFTTSNVFEELNRVGIATAFIERISDTEFLAEKCTMIPLEVICRRDAMGSMLKRRPELKKADGEKAHIFAKLLVEFFLKTTDNKCVYNGKTLISDLSVEDPFIKNPHAEQWKLLEPKTPYDEEDSFLTFFDSLSIISSNVTIANMTIATKNIFRVLESAFKKNYFRLNDFKIEFGITFDGRLVVSDVIDNDSWRVEDPNGNDSSKESFRAGENLTDVERKYLRIMEVTNNF